MSDALDAPSILQMIERENLATAHGQLTPQGGRVPLKMALAPDEGGEGRRLAAIFTAEDALQLFVVARESAAGELVSVRLSGFELFEQLASSAELDGVVFNACGPGAPVALAKDVAQLVLTGD